MAPECVAAVPSYLALKGVLPSTATIRQRNVFITLRAATIPHVNVIQGHSNQTPGRQPAALFYER